jgi:hypothetical protein
VRGYGYRRDRPLLNAAVGLGLAAVIIHLAHHGSPGGTRAAAGLPPASGLRVATAGLPPAGAGGVRCGHGPWSIFTQGGGDAVAVTWARRELNALGLPAGGWRLRFFWDWEKSEGGGGLFNPLNNGAVPHDPGLACTGSQYGGGAADYPTWAAGLAGSYAYLHMPHYAAVLAQLEHGTYRGATTALWASPWADGRYGGGSGWNYSLPPGG